MYRIFALLPHSQELWPLLDHHSDTVEILTTNVLRVLYVPGCNKFERCLNDNLLGRSECILRLKFGEFSVDIARYANLLTIYLLRNVQLSILASD